jgi:hypothetical protein
VSSPTSGSITTTNLFTGFTTINSVSTSACTIPSMPSNANALMAIGVNKNRTKMIFGIVNSSLYYTTSSDGITWAAPSSITLTGYIYSCYLSADGTRGIVNSNGGGMYSLYWTGSTPVLTMINAVGLNNVQCSITPDGNYIAYSGDGANPYFATWNTSTNQFNTGTQSSAPGATHHSLALTPLADLFLFLSGNILNYSTVSWNGSTATVGTKVATSYSLVSSDGGLITLGSSSMNQPTYLLFRDGTDIKYATFNTSTKVAGAVTTAVSATGCSNYSFTPCGNSGNIVYYSTFSANVYSIRFMTLSVT